MSQVSVVAGLALRELWISFRLLVLVAAFVGAGAYVALAPAPPAVTQLRLALGLGLAIIIATGLAAWSVADERRSGRAAWLVTRSVPRGTLLAGWFLTFAVAAIGGVAAAGILGWLALVGVSLQPDLASFVAVMTAIASGALAAIALGLAIGGLLPPGPAAVVGALSCLALGLAAAFGPGDLLPGAAHAALARLAEIERPVAAALRSGGSALLATAILLLLARMALERAEL